MIRISLIYSLDSLIINERKLIFIDGPKKFKINLLVKYEACVIKNRNLLKK